MSQDWLASYEALKSVYADGAYSNMALNEAIPHHHGCRDSFVRSMVKGTIRQTVTLDRIIDVLARDGLKGIRTRTLIILRMGLHALREMDSVPDHAAVNEAVSLARKKARGTDKFVNALLRGYIRSRERFEAQNGELQDPAFISEIQDKYEKMSVKYGFPLPIVKLICSQYGEEAEQILKGLNTPPPVILRTNTLKTTRDELTEALSGEGIKAEPVPEADTAIAAAGSGIIASDLYRDGLFSVQSLSSMLAVNALAPASGSRVLDMCAAPGGKSAMMAEMMEDTGSITACDIHEHRLDLIRATANRLGINIIETKLMDGTAHDSSLDGIYDFVLADVPCSGLGVMSTKPEIRFRMDEESMAQLPEIQLEILKNAVRYTRPGGRICYSTCTLNRSENDRVVEKLMSDEPTFGRIVEKQTVLPYNNTIGFYYCIIEKNLH